MPTSANSTYTSAIFLFYLGPGLNCPLWYVLPRPSRYPCFRVTMPKARETESLYVIEIHGSSGRIGTILGLT
jgi:hypothetical protein